MLKEGFAAYVAGAKEFKLALRNLQASQSRLCCAGQDVRSNDKTDAIKRLPNVLQALGLSKHSENFHTRAFAACVAGAGEFRRGMRRLQARKSRSAARAKVFAEGRRRRRLAAGPATKHANPQVSAGEDRTTGTHTRAIRAQPTPNLTPTRAQPSAQPLPPPEPPHRVAGSGGHAPCAGSCDGARDSKTHPAALGSRGAWHGAPLVSPASGAGAAVAPLGGPVRPR